MATVQKSSLTVASGTFINGTTSATLVAPSATQYAIISVTRASAASAFLINGVGQTTTAGQIIYIPPSSNVSSGAGDPGSFTFVVFSNS